MTTLVELSPADASLAASDEGLLHRALSATSCGLTIVDVTRPEHSLVYVNAGFERLAGLPREELLGRSARSLFGDDTEPAAVTRILTAVESGTDCRETLLAYRGRERTPWWNEVHLSPVIGAGGAIVNYVGVHQDVTGVVEAHRTLQAERDRSRAEVARLEQLAGTDPLTGLPDRRGLAQRVETALWDARVGDYAVAVLFLDVDGVAAINAMWGHAAGDEVLCAIAYRLRGRLRRRDVLARLGGHEFLVALLDLEVGTAGQEAQRIAADLVELVRMPAAVGGAEVPVGVRVGVSVYPDDGADFPGLLHAAALDRYAHRVAPATRL